MFVLVASIPWGICFVIALLFMFLPSESDLDTDKFITLRSSRHAFIRKIGLFLYALSELVLKIKFFLFKLICYAFMAAVYAFMIFAIISLFKN